MSDWLDDETPDVKAWKKEAQTLQQNLFLRLGDREWDEWQKSNIEILYRKVGFGLYPLSENLAEGNTSINYKEELSENIKSIADAILQNAESGCDIHFACIFVFGKIEDNLFFVPVFKVKGENDQTLFIDSNCHVYKSWQDYLKFNHLPKCLYCYPCDGLYKGDKKQVLIGFGKSLARDPKNKTLVTFASLSVMKSLFIVKTDTPFQAAMQISASTETCNTSAEDQQSQGNNSAELEEGMDYRLKIIGNVFNFIQSSIREDISLSAAAGEIPTREKAIAYNVASFGWLTVNNLEILNNICLLIDKKNKGTLTELDDLHFETCVLFFTNNLLQAVTAREVIEESQKEVLNQHCDDLTPSQIDGLFKLCEFPQGETQLQRTANNIKAINRISDKKTFYESLVNIKSDLEGYPVGFSSEGPGVINIDNELHIAPSKFVEISEADRQKILKATKKVKESANIDQYIIDILKKYKIVMQRQTDEKIVLLKRTFETENLDTIKIGDTLLFKNLTPSEVDRLSVVITGAGKYCMKIVKITNEFARKRKCKSPRDYCNYMEFVAHYMTKIILDKSNDFRKEMDDAEKNKGINRQIYMAEHGIRCSISEYFSNEVYDNFSEKSLRALEKKYVDLAEDVLPLNANMVPNFASDATAVSHYFKHTAFGTTKELTPDQYFSIASELINEPLNRRSAQLNQLGDRLIILFTNPLNGAVGVVFEKVSDGTQSLATVYYSKSVLKKCNK